MCMGGTAGRAALNPGQKAFNRKRLWIEMKKHKVLYLLMLPCVVSLIVFSYVPMTGIVLAFKNYRFDMGIYGSEWAGLKHFRKLLNYSL